MPAIRIQETASRHLDDIYCYTRDRWGEDQAKKYITGIFDAFEMIATHCVVSKPIPAEFGVDGFFFRYARHLVSAQIASELSLRQAGTALAPISARKRLE